MHKSSLLTLCIALTALAAQAAPVTSHNGVCRYRPGTPFTADIQISVSDREIRADSATVKINSTIPAGGRTAKASANNPSRYIAALERVPVHLSKDTIKHFDLVASVIVENPESANCQIKLDMAVSNRVLRTGWQEKLTNFHFKTDIIVEGRHTSVFSDVYCSCLDQETPILLADGSYVPIRKIIRGDLVRNPVTKAAVEVAEVIHGPQADEEMVRIGFGSKVVSFTAWHPLMTRSGLKPARAVQLEDEVLSEDGAYHSVTVRQPYTGDPQRSVFNLRLSAASQAESDHMMVAGGIVTGDFFLQNALKAAQKPAK
jgi:hypothetical protein